MRRINYLLACMVAVMTCATMFAAPLQQELPRPDLMVRGLELNNKNIVTVFIMNRGKADAVNCRLTLTGTGQNGETWERTYSVGIIVPGATFKRDFEILPYVPKPDSRLRAEVSTSAQEENKTNNTRALLVPKGAVPVEAPPKPAPNPQPTPVPTPPPAPAKPLVSPDMAAAGIYFSDKFAVGTLKNVGDRDYYTKDAKNNDSFKRGVTLTRVVHVGGTSYTENLGARTVPDLSVGKTFNYAFPLPNKVPGAIRYIWILTIEGEDANAKNNIFKEVQVITKID